jgi:hypothetical protein
VYRLLTETEREMSSSSTGLVALCMVVKNEAEMIERAIASARPYVDEVNVLDTGSDDGTLEILERMSTEPGAPLRVERDRADEFDFETARNRSYAMASREAEWLMWMDADEALIGAKHLPTIVQAADACGLNIIKVALEYNAGTPWAPEWRERLMRRGSGEWEGLAHATWSGRNQESLFAHPAAFRSEQGPKSPPGTWLRLAVRSAQRGDPRGLIDLGAELMATGGVVGAIEVYAEYLRVADRTKLDILRVSTSRWLMIALHQLGRLEEAADVNADLLAYMSDFPVIYRLDALSGALTALLTAPAGSAGPVLAVS